MSWQRFKHLWLEHIAIPSNCRQLRRISAFENDRLARHSVRKTINKSPENGHHGRDQVPRHLPLFSFCAAQKWFAYG